MKITGPSNVTPGTVEASAIPLGTVFTGTISGRGYVSSTSTFLAVKWFTTNYLYLVNLETGVLYPTFGARVANYVEQKDAEVKL
jgi:hypothetical protein